MSSSRSRPWVRDSSWWIFGKRVDGRVAGDQAVDVGEAEEPADSVHHRVDRGRHQPGVAEVADVQLDVRPLDADHGVEPLVLAPLEPPSKLVGVQVVGVAGVPSQVGHRRQLSRRHRVGLRWGTLPDASLAHQHW